MTQATGTTSGSTSGPICTIPDVQGKADSRRIPINKVGIKDIRHPVAINDQSGKTQHTVATFNMYVNLPHDFKGTHMSRFVELLNEHDEEITVESFREILLKMTHRLEAEAGHIEMRFTFFVKKAAPISGKQSLVDYDVTLIGDNHHGEVTLRTKIVVPVTSLCPCSKEISDYGAHNQRSHITAEVISHQTIWLEELISKIEAQASCEIYGLLKRPDEKYVTEKAYDNPKFVEDIVRDVAATMNADDRILAYVVESENFESIHNHSAYALIEHDKRLSA